ncbi:MULTISPECIES: DHA2 family efflux MFS transporter permease subunit [unclassified Beijerinckia]|uniref:DHA2 family efflux MFS transporter permease subunit n=1 Tax=unclassified Beijerinckia TaxID=2638183 RepID=UPI00089474C3|nr:MULTISPECIES: DHA2 family efflux MFS transporter permease subunit [unclassified Beijerinckia]MDH7797332.1 DHA2 family multidrug resistance protein [Beijerinckia sp. GAS462]SEC81371.1 MFS transporter, DHA2 family, multidrug resistance protein [Beijerinckia sp. 28-YEA-48]
MSGAAPVPHRGIIVVSTIAATLMQTLDSTIANVALPHMQGSLSATADQVTWVLTSYIVATAVMTAPVGWLSTRFGRKNFFVFCLAGFTIASALCGLAQSLEQIVLYRVIQGMTGAAIVPLSQSIMMDLYPPEERGSAMAMWGMGVMVGPIIGPTLGGWLTDMYDWRYVFFINVPVGIAAVFGIWTFLKAPGANKSLRFDWTGFVVLAAGLAALQLMLDRGAQNEWFASVEIVAEAVIACLGLYLFVVHICLAEKPLIQLGLFANTNFSVGLVMMLCIGAILVASVVLLGTYLQTLGGYSVWEAGLLLAPRGLGTMAAMMLAGRLADRFDPRLVMLFGFSLLGFGLVQMATWTPDIDRFTIVWVTMVQGFALGMIFVPLQVLAFATMPPQYRTDGTAFFSLVRNVGSAVGISVTTFVLSNATQVAHARIAETLTPFNRMMQTGGAYLLWNSAHGRGRAALNGEVTRQAMQIAYAQDFLLLALVAVPPALMLILMRRPPRQTSPGMVHAMAD